MVSLDQEQCFEKILRMVFKINYFVKSFFLRIHKSGPGGGAGGEVSALPALT